jgi:hypothetical protein
MVAHQDKDPQHQELYALAFGKRPAEELYDCLKDPEQLVNVAGDPAYVKIKEELSARLMEQLLATEDPRVTGGGDAFDTVTYLGYGPRHPSYKPGE